MATPVFISKLSKQDWQLVSAFTAVMNGRTVDFCSVGLTVWLLYSQLCPHTHHYTHTFMYLPHCQHHMQCTHSLLLHTSLNTLSYTPPGHIRTLPTPGQPGAMHTHYKCKEKRKGLEEGGPFLFVSTLHIANTISKCTLSSLSSISLNTVCSKIPWQGEPHANTPLLQHSAPLHALYLQVALTTSCTSRLH